MASPHHRDTSRRQVLGDAGGLRVMQDDDVAIDDDRRELIDVSAHHILVVGRLMITKLSTIAGFSVQMVMDALGDGEELLVAIDHQPARVDIGTPG